MEPTHIQRLAFIKYLYSIGLNQSNQPEPLCGISILSFHDSIELFLQLALEKLKIKQNCANFMDYWNVINDLAQKQSMNRLNKSRANLKHHGIIPSKLDIETFRGNTSTFYAENCVRIFGIEFDDISLVDIIKYERTRELLREAKNKFDEGITDVALEKLTLSFEYLLKDYEKYKKGRYSTTPLSYGVSLDYLSSVELDVDGKAYSNKKFFKNLIKSIEAMQKAIRIISFGIDYRKYIEIKSFLPHVNFLGRSGEPKFVYTRDITLSKEEFEFCFNFIIESALKLQEFDFELNIE